MMTTSEWFTIALHYKDINAEGLPRSIKIQKFNSSFDLVKHSHQALKVELAVKVEGTKKWNRWLTKSEVSAVTSTIGFSLWSRWSEDSARFFPTESCDAKNWEFRSSFFRGSWSITCEGKPSALSCQKNCLWLAEMHSCRINSDYWGAAVVA